MEKLRDFGQTWKGKIGIAVAAALILLVLIQLIPVNKTNPAVVKEPTWDSPRTRELAKAACFDCHSNETVWPWYAKIAPSSWLLARDVSEGRETLNFSDWGGNLDEIGELTEVIDEGEMPPWYYTLMHSHAKLSDSEKKELIAGLAATLVQSMGGSGG